MKGDKNVKLSDYKNMVIAEDNSYEEFFEISEQKAALISNLVKERIRKGWTQSQLAEKCGLKQPAIARIESSEVCPRLDTIMKIARVLEMEIVVEKKEVYEQIKVSKYIRENISFNEYIPKNGFCYSFNISQKNKKERYCYGC